MNEIKKNQASMPYLLPRGFEDLLPPDAETEFRAIGVLMKTFARFGYERVKPPMAEFEESLLAMGPGAACADQTFRVMDPQSEKMLALRSDITAQIARISGSRLSGAERPLRLTYANDVIRTRASQQRTLRQFCQVGCELIGADEIEDVVEVAVIALKGLSEVGVQNITIDFSLPRIVDAIFAASGVEKAEIDSLRASLSGTADKAIERLDALGLDANAAKHVNELRSIVSGVKKAIADIGISGVSFTVDPLETKGFEYHHGVAFTLFSADVHGELGRGGAYVLYHGETREAASGFTLYMDTVRVATPSRTVKERVFVPLSEGWGVLQKLQDDGWVTVRGVCGDDTILSTCTHVYKDGKVEEV